GNRLIRIQPEMRAPAMHHPWVGGVGHAVEARILVGRGRAPFADSNHPLAIERSHVLRVRALQDFGHRPRPYADTDIACHPGMDDTDVWIVARIRERHRKRVTRKLLSAIKRRASRDRDLGPEWGRCEGGHGVSGIGVVEVPGDAIAWVDADLDWREPRLDLTNVHRMVHRHRPSGC